MVKIKKDLWLGKVALKLLAFQIPCVILGILLMNMRDLPNVKEVKILEIKKNTIVVEYDETLGDIEIRELKKPFFFKWKVEDMKVGDRIYVKYNDKDKNIKISIKPYIFREIGQILIFIVLLTIMLEILAIIAVPIIYTKSFIINLICKNIKK